MIYGGFFFSIVRMCDIIKKSDFKKVDGEINVK